MQEQKITIATHNGSAVATEHNRRNRDVTDNEKHIDPNGVFEIWADENPHDAYHRLFDTALKDYNAKQSRDDRKITDYYEHISKNPQKHTVYEMIVGVYSQGDTYVDKDIGRDILKEFVDGWKERNPHLEMIGAYYHADEEGQPHVHIDYIPWADGYTRGLEKQTAIAKALQQQGFIMTGKQTEQIQWEYRENETLDAICTRHGLEVVHPQRDNIENKRKRLDTKIYKAQAEVDNLRGQADEMAQEYLGLQAEIDKKQTELSQLTEQETKRRDRLKPLTKRVWIPQEDLNELEDEAQRLREDIHNRDEEIKAQNEALTCAEAKQRDTELRFEAERDEMQKRAEKAEERVRKCLDFMSNTEKDGQSIYELFRNYLIEQKELARAKDKSKDEKRKTHSLHR